MSTKLYFGDGALDVLKKIKNKRVMIICDAFIEKSGLVNRVTERLDNCEVKIFSEVVPDPPIENITVGVTVLQEFEPNIIIALGGGSAIDAAKTIKEIDRTMTNGTRVIEECFAIPTTSGTGSEVTSFAVVTNAQKGIKYPLQGMSLLPTSAILDPNLVVSVPPAITADSGMDVLCHAIEAYVSTGASDFSDALAEKAIELIAGYLVRAYRNGEDLEAREKVHNASCLAGLAFNSAGLGITHSLAHAIGGKFHIAHGRCNAMLMAHVVEHNAKLNGVVNNNYSETAKRYQKIAHVLDLPANNTYLAVNQLIHFIKTLQRELHIPTTLTQCNVEPARIRELRGDVVEAALNDVCTSVNPVTVELKDLERIYDKIS